MIYNVDVETVLLQTKLFMPRLRPDHIPRPQLVARLNESFKRSQALTLISAPAGYGKTTILLGWLQEKRPEVAWISLDQADNEPARFFAYLVAALQQVDPAIGGSLRQRLQGPQLPAPITLMTSLINDVAGLALAGSADPDNRLILVLDDYQFLTTAAIHESIDFLIEHLPPQMHLVIVTRQDPPLALSRLRGRGLINEIRQNDLRFSDEEAARFLIEAMDLAIAESEITGLTERAEGWIAGLQLAALSMQGLDKAESARFIAGFSGRHHFILDYLTDEVLKRQPAPVQQFLLGTAILDQICGPLAEALLGGQEDEGEADPLLQTEVGVQALLERLDAANLFLIPLDDERRWYRYHTLFAELLRAKLRESQPEIVPERHRRAAVWYEQNGLMTAAVHHALQSGNMDMAADLIQRAIMNFTTWSRVEVATFLAWLRALPKATLNERPWLRLFYSRSLYVAGQMEAALQTIQALDSWLTAHPTAADAERLQGILQADYASYAVVQGNVSVGLAYAQRALASLPESDLFGRMRPFAILGMALTRQGDIVAAEEAFTKAINIAMGAELPVAAVPLICNLAETQYIQGQLSQAMTSSQRALRLGNVDGHPIASAGFAKIELGKIFYERNDLQASETNLREALELLSEGGITENFGNGPALLALVKQAQGDSTAAGELARQSTQIAQESQVRRLQDLADAYQVRIWLAQGAIGRAVQWARDYERLPAKEYLRELEEMTLARVYLDSDRATEALSLVDRLLASAEEAGRWGSVIHLLVLRAQAAAALDDLTGGLEALQRALDLAEPEGYRRAFLDAGPPLVPLLQQAVRQGISPDHAAGLLADFAAEARVELAPGSGRPQATVLVEPLTEREIEVLRLLAEGLSNREIARRLFLSPNTIRSHTYNLYSKLGVHSRTQAVARAREIELLPAD